MNRAHLCFLANLAALPRIGNAQAPAEVLPKHETFTIASRAVGETRTIHVYTPPGYASAPDSRLPVLYMPDGAMDEDFPHVVNTIDSLIALHEIRPVIVVGIPNTERRRDLTGPTAAPRGRGPPGPRPAR